MGENARRHGLFASLLFFCYIFSQATAAIPGEISATIRIKSCLMVVTDPSGESKEYSVATVKPGLVGNIPFGKSGRVTGITFNPEWYPTPATRRRYLATFEKELPKVVSAGNPANGLGKVAIYLHFPGWNAPLRIHDTPFQDSVGQRASSGCVRMHQEEADGLAREILAMVKSSLSTGEQEKVERILSTPLENLTRTVNVQIPEGFMTVHFENL